MMQFYPLFPVPLAEFYLPDQQLQQRVLDFVRTQPFIDNGASHSNANNQTDHYLHRKPELEPFVAWVNRCLEEYRTRMTYDCDSFDITIMWANRDLGGSGTHHPKHVHPGSFISGCYYCTGGSDIYFEDPIIQRKYNSIGVKQTMQERTRNYPVRAGYMILFPSWLEHGTAAHSAASDRWSIAFNVLPSGSVNSRVNASGNPSYRIRVE